MRMASLANEKEDTNQLTNGRNRIMGACVSWEYMQSNPFFFTREGSSVDLVGQYRGATAFLISNGPSLASGRYDLSLLKAPGILTYGINNGPKTIRPNFWSCVDDPKRFLKSIWLDPTITKFVPFGHAEKRLFDNDKWEDGVIRPNPLNGKDKEFLVGDCPNVYYFRRNSKFVANRFLWENTINWGNHKDYGGCRTVLLSVIRILFLLGFRKVYLLGVDLNMSSTKTYHFDEQRDPGSVKGNMETYSKMNEEYFPSLKKYFDAVDFKIYNCTEGSKLTAFPFVKYEDAIAETVGFLGEVKNERTWGLYSKPEIRQKFKDEPTIDKKPHLAHIKVENPSVKLIPDNLSANVSFSSSLPINRKSEDINRSHENIARDEKVESEEEAFDEPQIVQVRATDFVRHEDKERDVPKNKKISKEQVVVTDRRVSRQETVPVPDLIFKKNNKLVFNNASAVKTVVGMKEIFNAGKDQKSHKAESVKIEKDDKKIIRSIPGFELDTMGDGGFWIPDNGK